MKNRLFMIVSVLLSFTLVFLLMGQSKSKTFDKAAEKKLSEDIVKELVKERELLKKKERELDQLKQNLESFEIELNKKHEAYLKNKKELEQKEAAFNKKLEDATLDAQTIESYEAIDAEQGALLMQSLYKKDPKLPPMIFRKISGKKAGKLLEALVDLDTETSAKLAKEILEFFKPDGAGG